MTVLSPGQLQDVWTRNGGDPTMAAFAAAIAMAESGGNPAAVSPVNPNGTRDQGLWQISRPSLEGQLLDADFNARLAIQESANGSNWTPWCTAFANPNRDCGHLGPSYLQAGARVWQFVPPGATLPPHTPSGAGGTASTAPAQGAPQTLTQGPGLTFFPADWWKGIIPGTGSPGPSILTDSGQFSEAMVRLAEILAGGLLMGAGIVLVAYSLLGKELRQSPALLAGVAGGAAGVAESAVIRVRSRPTSAQRSQARSGPSRPRGPERAPGEMRRERAQRPARVRVVERSPSRPARDREGVTF